MKHLTVLALVGVLVSTLETGKAQSLSPTQLSQTRADLQKLNAQLPKARRSSAFIEGQSAEGAELTNFWRGRTLLKSTAIFYGETGKLTQEIWYSRGAPFFVFEANSFYDRPLSGRVVRCEEKRSYFQNGRLAAYRFGMGWQSLPLKLRLALEREIYATAEDYARRAR